MATETKDRPLSLRMTKTERQELEATANSVGSKAGPLAQAFVREGVRRARFPAIEFRDGSPGRVAYLSGTRWPVWMIVQVAEECQGKLAEVVKAVHRPEALIRMALAYAESYPDEIRASLDLHAERDFEELKRQIPHLERL